jgi:hypothetical protein
MAASALFAQPESDGMIRDLVFIPGVAGPNQPMNEQLVSPQ